MNVFKALATVVGTALGFGVAGTVIGTFLGKYTPGLFRSLLPYRDPETFNPMEVGVGLGLVNGLISGMVIGILIVAILCWREVRLLQDRDAANKDGE